MKRWLGTLLLCLFIVLPAAIVAQEEMTYVAETDSAVLGRLEQWRDLKFGLLMHWGPYSQWGIVESWSICSEDEGWCRRKSDNYEQYKKEYEGLKKTFNPINFDPDRWAQAAKKAGMRYVVFTTKHHDGFCMFDTRQTDYKVTDPDCPFSKNPKANITKEIFSSFRKNGFWTGAYFSKPDWHSEYYWWPNFATPDRNVNYDISQYPERWENFVQFTHNQIDELLTDYGRVDILWLDGGWVRIKSKEEIQKAINSPDFKFVRHQSQDIRMNELVEKARRKQPGIIVVDRAVPGKNQNYLTPENVVPNEVILDPWESCIISGGGWSWMPNAKYMSRHKAISTLVDVVSKGGNLLLNIAPGPDGSWDEGAYALLREIGAWMDVNSEAIYGTRPFAPYSDHNLRFTKRGDSVTYIFYVSDEKNPTMPSRIDLKQISIPKDSKVTLLGSKSRLRVEKTSLGSWIEIPKDLQLHPPCRDVWVLKVER